MARRNGLWKFRDCSVSGHLGTDVQGVIEDERGGTVAMVALGEHPNDDKAGLARARAAGQLFAKAPELHRLVLQVIELREANPETNPILVGVVVKRLAEEAASLLGEAQPAGTESS